MFREFAKEKLKKLEKQMVDVENDSSLMLEISYKCFKCKKDVKKNELCLLDLQINYFEKCLNYVTASCDFMVDDEQLYPTEFKDSSGELLI